MLLQGFIKNGKYLSLRWVVVWVLFFFISHSFAQVTASIDTTQIKIGEEIKYAISVETDSLTPITFPEGQTFLPLEVIDFYPTDTIRENQRVTLIKKYGLTQFDSGRYVIPQQLVRIREQAYFTDTLVVEVADVEVDTLKQGMYDIKPHIAVPPVKTPWFTSWGWIVLLVLVIAWILYLLFKKLRTQQTQEKRLPPFEEALVALQQLDASDYLRQNKVKDYYSGLTEIVKRYLDREVDNAVLESTTEELITKLEIHKNSGNLDFDIKTIDKLREILQRADLVKFAKMQTDTGQVQLDRQDIEEIIKETHQIIPQPTEEELLQEEQYRQEVLRKKRRRKNTIIISSSIGMLLLGLVIWGTISGMEQVRNTLFGNYTKSLLEQEWVKSDYGHPAVVIETPEVLVRKSTSDGFTISDNPEDVFTFGDIQKELFVYVGSSKTQQIDEDQLRLVLQEKLALLEKNGAINLIVNDEPFETQKGVKGFKAAGEFNIHLGDNSYKKTKSEYLLLVFAQEGAIQEVLVVNEKEDVYAQQIKERIINSVEIEVFKAP